MKKVLSLLLVLILAAFITACGDTDKEDNGNDNNENAEQANSNTEANNDEQDNNTEENNNDAQGNEDRKSTRLNSSHVARSYAVCCMKEKKSTLETILKIDISTPLH